MLGLFHRPQKHGVILRLIVLVHKGRIDKFGFMDSRIIRGNQPISGIAMLLASVALHRCHVFPSLSLQRHCPPNQCQRFAGLVSAKQMPFSVVPRIRNPRSGMLSGKTEEEIVHFFGELAYSALAEECMVPGVVDTPLGGELHKRIDAVSSCTAEER